MESAPAWLLLFLLLTPGGATAGEKRQVCYGWTPDGRQFAALLSCPQVNGPRDAVFCCGTCSKPRCCSSEEDQLDLQRCQFEPTPPPPVLLPHVMNVLFVLMGMIAFAAVFACANFFSTQIGNCLVRSSCCLRTACCRRCWPRREDQTVQMSALTRHSNIYSSLPTVSKCVEESEGAASILPPALPDRDCLRTDRIAENDAVLLPAVLQNTSDSSPILEASVEMEYLSGSQQ